MRHLGLIVVALFSFVAFDLNLTRRRPLRRSEEESIQWRSEDFLNLNEKKTKRKRQYKNKKITKRQKYRERVMAIRGTKAKDHRFSNQRKLRRMYRNH